ncbi:PREDICTED: uncharacterized protein LOC106786300 [Polistes canadensis]|uniref:uncharacterized protein LOC106786300 n=1 Tax=Polistes canadensis TaxID=91411 RepID=UPI000718D85A|nr:PREDICTED: uncharacterized protein LOC106786300 [Polistes canadensis]
MSDYEDSEDYCGEEEVIPKWEITREWLKGIFSEYYMHMVDICELKTTSIRKSDATLSNENVLCDITYAEFDLIGPIDVSEMRIVIKRLPADLFNRFFVTEGQYDLREIKFYTKIVPDLKLLQPQGRRVRRIEGQTTPDDPLKLLTCYYAHYSPPERNDDSPKQTDVDSLIPPESVLVLSNFDLTSFSFSEGLSVPHAKAALDSIAGIHGLSLCMKMRDDKPLPDRYPFLFQKTKATDSYQQMVERGFSQLANFLECLPGLEPVLEALMALRPKTKDIIMNLLAPESPIATITHTDFWCKNLQFAYTPGIVKCYIVDWQMVAYSRPTNDVALLLVSSLPSELRRKYTKLLLDAYWNSLNEWCLIYGLDIPKDLGYTREDLSEDYRKSQLLALLLCIGSIDIALEYSETKQRLIDVLQDLHEDGILTEETAITRTEAEA